MKDVETQRDFDYWLEDFSDGVKHVVDQIKRMKHD